MDKGGRLFFQQENSHNHRCRFCGASLWTVQNPDELTPKRTQWVRIGGYGYVHRRFAYQAAQTCKKAFRAKIEEVVERPDGLFPAAGALPTVSAVRLSQEKAETDRRP